VTGKGGTIATQATTMPPFGRVAQLARARRLQRQTGGISPTSGDQQEQPFVQVRPEYSVSSKWQRVAPSGTGWTKFRMSFRPGIGQSSRRFSGACRPLALAKDTPELCVLLADLSALPARLEGVLRLISPGATTRGRPR
jgi:hypothetical protein